MLNKLGKAGEEILMLINKAREVIGKEARATKYADELKRLKRNRIIKGLPEFRAKIPNDVTSKIPSNFIEKPNKKNVGFRWQDPNNRNNSIRIDKGDPASPFTSQRVDHVVVNSNGKVIGRNGMPINNNKIQDDPINAHIPLSEYKKWKSWNTQN